MDHVRVEESRGSMLTPSECPDCGATPAQTHANGCDWAAHWIGEPEQPLLLTVERSIAMQAAMLQCVLAGEDDLRRMSRPEFRALLRERLQLFGDEIMVAWEKMKRADD